MYRTKDQVAQEFITEGHRRAITERGIVICIATGLVESNLTVDANPKVPDSMNLPHDGVGTDSFSVGPLQQQVVWGQNGWWWGDAATCMDPTLSAGLFYGRLVRLDYNNTANSPGSYAQAVQSSAFPDRYDERMGEAQAIYDRLNDRPAIPVIPAPLFNEDNRIEGFNNFSGRNGRTVDLLIVHTEEPKLAPYARNAQSLYDFCKSTTGEAAVSYHYSIGQNGDGSVDAIDMVDTDYECWAVLDSNPDSINYCFANSSVNLTEQEWMDQFGNAIDVCAYLIVQDAHKYDVPIKMLTPPYNSDPPGITDHKYVTQWLGDGSHTDVGDNFPWPYFTDRINHYASNTGDDDVPTVKRPSGSIYRDNNNVLPWEGTEMDFVIDAQNNEGRVEQLAKDGDPRAIKLVRRTAEGKSPVNDSLSDDDRAHAKAIANLLDKQEAVR